MANEALISKLAFCAASTDECAPMWLKASQADRRDSDQRDHGTHDTAREMSSRKSRYAKREPMMMDDSRKGATSATGAASMAFNTKM